MSASVAIAGASGYAGGEMLRLLLDHPEVRIGALTAHANAGESVTSLHPHLAAHPSLAGRRFEATTAAALADHDVVVLALPHGASGAIAAELESRPGRSPLVLDLGADHRLADPQAWRDYYGSEHAGTWTYGLPELMLGAPSDDALTRQRERLAGTTRVAVPGCNVTAVTLGIQPGVATGLVDAAGLVAVLAVGYSGAGKSAKTHLLASEGLGSAAPYAVGGSHRHIPEIVQNLRACRAPDAPQVRISFTPVLVPMSRGILATTSAPIAADISPSAVRAAWVELYADEPFVHVLPPGEWPTSAATLGSNVALVQVAVDERAGRVVTVCAIDNLVKGTAGGAVQSMNLALGMPETLGLPRTAVAP